jgi:hypothetical protein
MQYQLEKCVSALLWHEVRAQELDGWRWGRGKIPGFLESS